MFKVILAQIANCRRLIVISFVGLLLLFVLFIFVRSELRLLGSRDIRWVIRYNNLPSELLAAGEERSIHEANEIVGLAIEERSISWLDRRELESIGTLRVIGFIDCTLPGRYLNEIVTNNPNLQAVVITNCVIDSSSIQALSQSTIKVLVLNEMQIPESVTSALVEKGIDLRFDHSYKLEPYEPPGVLIPK